MERGWISAYMSIRIKITVSWDPYRASATSRNRSLRDMRGTCAGHARGKERRNCRSRCELRRIVAPNADYECDLYLHFQRDVVVMSAPSSSHEWMLPP
jgi:hypothetical protein